MQVEAVVRRVLWLIRNPEVKILVFSTWSEVLQLLEHALSTNHVPCVRAKTRKDLERAIQDFRAPRQKGAQSLQTILLHLKQGGNGLNLTGALHLHSCQLSAHFAVRVVHARFAMCATLEPTTALMEGNVLIPALKLQSSAYSTHVLSHMPMCT